MSSTDCSRGLDVIFRDVIYDVPIPEANRSLPFRCSTMHSKRILNKVSGHVRSGSTLAVLGPSGSGKTSLLNVISGRTEHPPEGTLLFNGHRRTPRTRRDFGYCTQDDIFFSNLTVRETLQFTANVRLPNSVTAAEKKKRVDDMLRRLRLTKCQNIKIGDQVFDKGISGGERKRLNLANELLHSPRLILADECTSGLDSSSAYLVVNMLRNLSTTHGTTVIASIHQPSSRIFGMFDSILLLSAGKVAYLGSPQKVIEHFEGIGFSFPTAGYNPADFIMELVSNDIKPELDPTGDSVQVRVLKAWENLEFACRDDRNEGDTDLVLAEDQVSVPSATYSCESDQAEQIDHQKDLHLKRDAVVFLPAEDEISRRDDSDLDVVSSACSSIRDSSREKGPFPQSGRKKDVRRLSSLALDANGKPSEDTLAVSLPFNCPLLAAIKKLIRHVREQNEGFQFNCPLLAAIRNLIRHVRERNEGFQFNCPIIAAVKKFIRYKCQQREGLDDSSQQFGVSGNDTESSRPLPCRILRAITKRYYDLTGQHGKDGTPDKYAADWCAQLFALGWRSLRQKNGSLFHPIYIFQIVCVTVVCSLAWFRIEATESTIEDRLGALSFCCVFWALHSTLAALVAFPSERKVLKKDRDSGIYRLSSYYFAKTVIELPADMLYPFLFSLAVYFTIGLNPYFGSFILFTTVMILNALTARGVGHLISAVLVDVRKAQVIGMLWILASMLLSGYYIDPANTRSYFNQLRHLSFIKYSYEALIRIEMLSGRTFVCADASEVSTPYSGNGKWCPVDKEALLNGASIQNSLSIGGNIAVLIAWTICTRLFGYFALKMKRVKHKTK